MSIEHFRILEGIPFDLKSSPEEAIARAITSPSAIRSSLHPGVHMITPPVWREFGTNTYNYNVLVNEDGRGVLRMTPTHSDSSSVMLGEGENSELKIGERVMLIPEEAGVFPIVGPKKGDPTIRIYEVILYVPDL